MIDDYKRAMDRVKTDDAYKAEFLASLEAKTTKKKRLFLLPSYSYIASAAALFLVVYCTALFFIKQPDDAKIKLEATNENSDAVYTQTSNNVVYFTFEGFNSENQPSAKAVLLYGYDEDYTLANLLEDYYPIIADEESDVKITDGMVDSFLGETAEGKKEINVYVNDYEVLNLDNKLVSECLKSEENVYFKVSVVE